MVVKSGRVQTRFPKGEALFSFTLPGMPKPGPKAYECIRRAWHSESHSALRVHMKRGMHRLVIRMHKPDTVSSGVWETQMPRVVLRLDEILYSKAKSQAEYEDMATLPRRLNEALDIVVGRLDDAVDPSVGPRQLPCIEASLILCSQPITSPSGRSSRALAGSRGVIREIRPREAGPGPRLGLEAANQETPEEVGAGGGVAEHLPVGRLLPGQSIERRPLLVDPGGDHSGAPVVSLGNFLPPLPMPFPRDPPVAATSFPTPSLVPGIQAMLPPPEKAFWPGAIPATLTPPPRQTKGAGEQRQGAVSGPGSHSSSPLSQYGRSVPGGGLLDGLAVWPRMGLRGAGLSAEGEGLSLAAFSEAPAVLAQRMAGQGLELGLMPPGRHAGRDHAVLPDASTPPDSGSAALGISLSLSQPALGTGHEEQPWSATWRPPDAAEQGANEEQVRQIPREIPFFQPRPVTGRTSPEMSGAGDLHGETRFGCEAGEPAAQGLLPNSTWGVIERGGSSQRGTASEQERAQAVVDGEGVHQTAKRQRQEGGSGGRPPSSIQSDERCYPPTSGPCSKFDETYANHF